MFTETRIAIRPWGFSDSQTRALMHTAWHAAWEGVGSWEHSPSSGPSDHSFGLRFAPQARPLSKNAVQNQHIFQAPQLLRHNTGDKLWLSQHLITGGFGRNTQQDRTQSDESHELKSAFIFQVSVYGLWSRTIGIFLKLTSSVYFHFSSTTSCTRAPYSLPTSTRAISILLLTKCEHAYTTHTRSHTHNNTTHTITQHTQSHNTIHTTHTQ